MLEFLKKQIYPIGIDLGTNFIKMAQLGSDKDGLYLRSALCEGRPEDVAPGSGDWQRWAVRTLKEMVGRGKFKGRELITAMPSEDVFIDQVKVPKNMAGDISQAVVSAVKRKLPFDVSEAMIRHVPVELANVNGHLDVLVMAAKKSHVDRHLAIYEKAGLEITGMSVWPLAMTNSYVSFFTRRSSDKEAVTMLMDISAMRSNIVICRHSDLLFARVMPIGFSHLAQGQMIDNLAAEMDACCRYFESTYSVARVQRLVFLSGRNVDKGLCDAVSRFAQRMQVSAQIGDVLAAVATKSDCNIDIDRDDSKVDWATAFGLSMANNI